MGDGFAPNGTVIQLSDVYDSKALCGQFGKDRKKDGLGIFYTGRIAGPYYQHSVPAMAS